MSIIKVRKDSRERFLITDVEIHERTDMTWEACGLHAYLMTKPDNWQVRVEELANAKQAGVKKIQRILKELEEAGYLYRERERDAEGKFSTITVVYERVGLNEHHTPIYGGTIEQGSHPQAETAGGPQAVIHGGKRRRIIRINKTNNIKGDPPENSWQEPDPDAVQEMMGKLSSACQGFANFLLGDQCPFYQSAFILVDHGYTIEDVDGFSDWWAADDGAKGKYPGKPALKTLMSKIEGWKDGTLPATAETEPAEQAWTEIWEWLNRKRTPFQFTDQRTLQALRQIGTDSVRNMGDGDAPFVKKRFVTAFNGTAL